MARLEIYLMFNYNNHTIMNKTEFISAVAAKAGLTKVDAKKAVDAFIDTVAEEMKKGEKVSILGFGSFSVALQTTFRARFYIHDGWEAQKVTGLSVKRY